MLGKLVFTLDAHIITAPAEITEPSVEALRSGHFDALFIGGSLKLSELDKAAQIRPPSQTVEPVSLAPRNRTSMPNYSPLARAARVGGRVKFALDITSTGGATNVRTLEGHPFCDKQSVTKPRTGHFQQSPLENQLPARSNSRPIVRLADRIRSSVIRCSAMIVWRSEMSEKASAIGIIGVHIGRVSGAVTHVDSRRDSSRRQTRVALGSGFVQVSHAGWTSGELIWHGDRKCCVLLSIFARNLLRQSEFIQTVTGVR